MVSINTVILGGNLTRDPEVRYTPQGTAVATFGMAISRTFRTKEGEQKDEVCFIDVETWGRQAETCGEYLKKGRPVVVEGRLKLDTWENKEGQKRSKHKINALRVQFLGGRSSASPKEESDFAPPPAPYEETFPPDEADSVQDKPADDVPF